MPRRVSLIVLHEDTLHQSFAAAFLPKVGLDQRPTRYVSGRNKAGVIKSFADQVDSLLGQGSETHLFVIMDADGQSYGANKQALLETLNTQQEQRLQQLGRWHLICPDFELENWARFLEGQNITEARNLALGYEEDSDCRGAARLLAHHCRQNIPLVQPLASLSDACVRWNAYRARHGL